MIDSLYPWQRSIYSRMVQNFSLWHHAYLVPGLKGSGSKVLVDALVATYLGRKHILDHPDVFRIVPEKGVIKVEQAREAMNFSGLTSRAGRGRVLIIEQAEQLNQASANAMLKLLEEPPERFIAFLLIDSLQLVLPTLRSRCQKMTHAEVEGTQSSLTQCYLDWLRSSSGADNSSVATALKLSYSRPLVAKELLEEDPALGAKIAHQILGILNLKVLPEDYGMEWSGLGQQDSYLSHLQQVMLFLISCQRLHYHPEDDAFIKVQWGSQGIAAMQQINQKLSPMTLTHFLDTVRDHYQRGNEVKTIRPDFSAADLAVELRKIARKST